MGEPNKNLTVRSEDKSDVNAITRLGKVEYGKAWRDNAVIFVDKWKDVLASKDNDDFNVLVVEISASFGVQVDDTEDLVAKVENNGNNNKPETRDLNLFRVRDTVAMTLAVAMAQSDDERLNNAVVSGIEVDVAAVLPSSGERIARDVALVAVPHEVFGEFALMSRLYSNAEMSPSLEDDVKCIQDCIEKVMIISGKYEEESSEFISTMRAVAGLKRKVEVLKGRKQDELRFPDDKDKQLEIVRPILARYETGGSPTNDMTTMSIAVELKNIMNQGNIDWEVKEEIQARLSLRYVAEVISKNAASLAPDKPLSIAQALVQLTSGGYEITAIEMEYFFGGNTEHSRAVMKAWDKVQMINKVGGGYRFLVERMLRDSAFCQSVGLDQIPQIVRDRIANVSGVVLAKDPKNYGDVTPNYFIDKDTDRKKFVRLYMEKQISKETNCSKSMAETSLRNAFDLVWALGEWPAFDGALTNGDSSELSNTSSATIDMKAKRKSGPGTNMDPIISAFPTPVRATCGRTIMGVLSADEIKKNLEVFTKAKQNTAYYLGVEMSLAGVVGFLRNTSFDAKTAVSDAFLGSVTDAVEKMSKFPSIILDEDGEAIISPNAVFDSAGRLLSDKLDDETIKLKSEMTRARFVVVLAYIAKHNLELGWTADKWVELRDLLTRSYNVADADSPPKMVTFISKENLAKIEKKVLNRDPKIVDPRVLGDAFRKTTATLRRSEVEIISRQRPFDLLNNERAKKGGSVLGGYRRDPNEIRYTIKELGLKF